MLDFNIENDGVRSLDAVVAILRAKAPDVATLQECSEPAATKIALALGWSAVVDPVRDLAILGPHPMKRIGVSEGGEWGGIGATIDRGRHGRVHVFDVRLDWREYGPYRLLAGDGKDAIIESENRVRKSILDAVLTLMQPALASKEPTFLAGDFNAPSDLDYDDFSWPTSIACRDNGLVDSFRFLYPRVAGEAPPYARNHRGITWSPLPDAEQKAFDRIDFVYFASAARVRPVGAVTLDETSGLGPWPSDHRALLTTFELP